MFALPHTTIVNRAVPKNSFDAYMNSKQKKLLSTHIDKIKWRNKLSTQTIKLEGKYIQEIQLFNIYLKQKDSVEEVLTIIDKSIPYHIIFVLIFNEEVMFSAAQKHLHPTIDNVSVIDWRFISPWVQVDDIQYQLHLKNTLDYVFTDFCLQLIGKTKNTTLQETIRIEQKKKKLLYEIDKLESEVKRCKQFNRKVELNIELQTKKKVLSELSDL